MTKETIYSSYKTVEAYLQQFTPTADALAIQPIDTLIARLAASFYPSAPVVLDLAADATDGASTAMWLSVCPDYVQHVLVPESERTADWRAVLTEAAPVIGIDEAYLKVQLPTGGASNPAAPVTTRGKRPPLFVSIGITRQMDEPPLRVLDQLAHTVPAHLYVVLMHGQHMDSDWLAALHHFSQRDSTWRLTALRDRSAFFAFSHLALLYRADDSTVESVLERIAALYKGNYQHIDLVRTNLDLMLTNDQLEKRLKEAQASLSDLKNAHPRSAQSAIPSLPEPGSRLLRAPFRAARGIYRTLLPLPVRLRLRDMRVRLIGW